MKFKNLLLGTFALLSFNSLSTYAQTPAKFTRADTLRGMLTPLRTCYDVGYYHLDVKFNIADKSISGSNLIRFKAMSDFTRLQFDLFDNLKIERIIYKGKELPYQREFNAVFVNFPQTVKKGSIDEIKVYYSGNPRVAKKAPWDGGVVYTTDSLGKPWVATACQGLGASVWWPNKDHQSDEPDSMLISISVPSGLKDISNGRLRKVTKLKDGYTRYDWFVSNPINNYDVAANIGNYVHFGDSYNGEKGKLTLDYWVLPEHLEKAKKQFGENVKPMLQAFEHWFGPYPFYEDGYKLVESPHLGMEHQSAVAYGNKFQNGYLGTDRSQTGWGLKWDFIIIHESGHEWFGNNITSKDIADTWIHEGFTTYSESLFTESRWGKQAGQEYVHGQRRIIRNDAPIISHYNVNEDPTGDVYDKGANLLNMVRTIINDDEKWRSILRGLNKEFYHQTVTTEQVVGYINKQAGVPLLKVFDQYLHYKNIPTLEFREQAGKMYARWIADVDDFDMPVRVRVKGGEYQIIKPTTTSREIKVEGLTKENLQVDTFNFYIGVLVE
ncbi:M1 family metallopeptidase [Mucilaginibacter sp. RS28]|uniref:M1 family metallopeptidase n=1 Tax=Mucilaginibacter straminoryzae TaxID=2932774 RepID=A0A9X2B8E0_9SPHI|nr:M1 family metallopeptidase [Mucilaginibacter straminoryzae]MCJ8209371.1 M1 family metallopeptidase [Mucilaginibacter straminoryzae]